jgi:hypothetical protein
MLIVQFDNCYLSAIIPITLENKTRNEDFEAALA